MVCRKPAAPGPVPQGLADECAPLELVREYRLGGRLVGEVVSAQVGRELIRRRPGRGRRGVLGLSVPGLRPTSASTVSTRRTSSVDPVRRSPGKGRDVLVASASFKRMIAPEVVPANSAHG